MKTSLAMLLALLLIPTAFAQSSFEHSDSDFSVDKMTFSLDWDDQQFSLEPHNCNPPDLGEPRSPECPPIEINFDDSLNRNQPPQSNQLTLPSNDHR